MVARMRESQGFLHEYFQKYQHVKCLFHEKCDMYTCWFKLRYLVLTTFAERSMRLHGYCGEQDPVIAGSDVHVLHAPPCRFLGWAHVCYLNFFECGKISCVLRSGYLLELD